MIDISVPLTRQLPVWPGGRGCTREWISHVDRGDAVTETFLTMDVHAGTHIDAPSHFVPGGASVDTLPLESMRGPAYVADLTGVPVLTDEVLRARVPEGVTKLLMRTDNSRRRLFASSEFAEDFVALDSSGAGWVVDHGVTLVGNDYLSIETYSGDGSAHRKLFSAETIVLEGLDLADVEPGYYELHCMPLSIPGAEAAPVRAALEPTKALSPP